MANSRDNGMGVSEGLLLWFHLNPLQRLFPSCLPLPTPPARPSSGPGCFCRAAGCRDGSPVTEDASAGHCPSTHAWGPIYLQHRKFTQRTDANTTHTQLISLNFFTTQFWHLFLSEAQEQGPKCPTIPVCLRPKLRIPQRLSFPCCSVFFTHSPSMAIRGAKAQAVVTYQMAFLALPAEAPAKVLLFAFGCQPALPIALSQTADISSPVSMSFVHQSSSPCYFMMCCKTTTLPWVCSAWLPHLSLLSLHTGTSSITASLELRVRTWSVLLP